MIGGADSQILANAWTQITDNFSSGAVFWGIIFILDFVVAVYRYHKTREVAEFVKTFALMLIISVGISIIFTYVKGT